MKRILPILMALFLLSGCSSSQSATPTAASSAADPAASATSVTETAAQSGFPSETAPAVSYDQQKAIIMSLSSSWMPTEWYASWYYTICDLDHNGRSEIIVASCQGSGLYTYDTFYELNEDYSALVPCAYPIQEGESKADIIADSAECYYSSTDETWWYTFQDVIRINVAEHVVVKDAISLKNGTVSQIGLGRMDHSVNENGAETSLYYQNGTEITAEQYDALEQTHFAGMPHQTVTFDWVLLEQPTQNSTEPQNTGVVSSQNAASSQSTTSIRITKNPKSECLAPGGKTWFIAKAEGSDSLLWVVLDQSGNEYSLTDAMAALPGISLQDLGDGTIAVSNVPIQANGWSLVARFSNQSGSSTTEPAVLYVGDYLTQYAPVLNAYKSMIGGVDAESLPYELSTDLDIQSANLGYKLKDLDKDGSPELLIAGQNVGSGSWEWDDIIYSAFTLKNGSPEKLFHSWARNRYYYSSEGFYYCGSGGASYSDNYIWKFGNGTLQVKEGVYTDDAAQPYYHVTGGDRYEGVSTAIDESTFYQYQKTYEGTVIPLGTLTSIS